MPEEVKTSVGLPTAALPPSKTSKASKMQKTTSASALSSRLLERVSDGSRSQKLVTKPHVEMTDVNTTLPSWEDATRDVKTSVDFVPVSHTGVGMRKSTTKSSTESAYSSDVLDRNITTSLTKATEHAEELTAATYLEHGQRKMSTVTWEFEKETPERKVISMAQTATSSTSDEDMDSSSTTTEVSSKSPVDGSSGSTIKIDVATLAGVGTSTASVVAEGMKWMAASTPALSTSLATPVSAEILASTDYTRKEYTSRIQMEVTGSSEVSGMASTENKTTLSTGLTEIVTSELPEMLTASTAHWQSSIDTLETVSMASSENPTVKHFAVVAEDESTISGVVTVEKSVLEGDKTTLTTDTSKDVTEDVASISTAPSATRAWDDMAKVTSTSVSRTDVERMTASESGTMSTPTEVAAELSSASTTEADLLTKVVALDSSTEEGFSSSTRADVAGGSSSVLTTLTLKDDKPLTLSSTVTEVMESPEGSSTTSIPEVIPAELLTASTSEVKDVKVVAQSTLSTLVEETSTRVAEKLSSTTTTPDIMEVLGVSTSTVTSESPDSYAESILSSALTEVDELLKLSTTTMVPELTTPEQETSKSTLTSHHSVRQSLASTSTEVHHVPERTSLLWTPGTSTETSLELLTEETPSTTEGTMVDATMDTRETTTIVGGSDKTTEKEWVSSSETSLELDTRSEAEQSLTSVGLTVEELAVITGQETTTVTGLNLTRPSSISTTETIDVMGSKLAVTSTEVGKTEVHTRAGSVAMTGTSSMGEADDVAQTLSTSSLPERESRMDYTTESTVTSSYSQIDMEESIGSTFTPEVKPETFPSTSTEKTEVTTISKTPATSTTSFTVVPEDFPEKYSSVLVSDVETVATSTASTEAIKLDLELETTVSSPSTDVSVREDVEVVTTSTIPTLTRTLAHSTTLTESSELPVWSEESSTEHTEMVTSETTKILTETTTIIASSEGKMDLDTSTSSEVGLETKEYEAFSPLVSTSVEVLKTSSVSMDTSLATTPDVADTERTSTKIPTIMDIVLETGSSTTFSPVIEEKLPSVTFPQTETSPVLDVEKLTSSTTLPEMQLEVLNASTHTVFGATITDELASELMSTSVAGSTLEEVAPTQFGPTLTTTPEGSLDTSSITTGVLTEETEIGDIEDFASSSTVTEATERLAWSTITWIPEVVKEDLGSTSTERILETTKTSEGSSTTSQLEDIELTRPTSTSPYAEGLTEALEESSLASSTSADIERPESTSLSTRLVSTATTEVPTFSSTTLLEELTKKLASVSTTTELTETSGTSAGSTSTETFLDVAVEKRASTSTMKQTVTTKMVEDFTSTSVVPEETTTETSTFASSVAELSMVEEMEMSTVTLTPDVVKLEEISTSTEVPLTTEGSERATLTSTSETITERVVTTSTQGLTEDTTSSLEFSSSTTILEGRTEEELTALSTVVSTSSATEMSQSSTSSTPLKDTSLTEKTSTSTPETITTSKISEGSSPSTTFSEDYVTEEISSTFSPSETAEGHKTMTTTTPLILEGATELPGMSTSTITLQTTYHELSSSTVAFETTPVKEVFSETSAHSITSEMPTEVSTGSTPEHVSGEEEAISISQSTISTPSSPDAKTRWALTSTTPEVVDKILVSSTSRMSEIPEISDAPTTKTTSEDLVHSEPRSMTSSTTEDLEHVADEQLTTASTLSEELVTVVPDASTGTTGIFKGSSGEEFGLSSTTSSVQTTKGVELSSVTTDIPEETGDTDVISLSTLTTKVAPTTLHLSTMSTTADETKFSSPKHSESTTERVTEAIVLDQTTTTRILVTLSDVKETVFMPSTESSSEMEVTMATSEASSVSTTPREDLVTETPSSSTVREGQEEALDVSSSSTILDDVDTESQLSEGTTDSTTPAEPFVFKETESTSVTEMTDTVIKSSWSTSTLAQLEHKDVEHLSSPTDTVTSVTTLPSKTETPEYTESFEKEILVDHSVATYSTEVTTSPTASHSTTVYDEVPSVDDYSRPTSTSRPTTDLEDDFSSSSTTSDLSTFATESSIASTLLWTPESAETLPETSTTNYSATTMSELEVSLLTTTATDSDWIEDKVSTSTEASLVHLASAAVRETSESVSDTTVLSPELSSIGTAYETASTSPRLPSSHGSSTPLVDSTDELPSATMTTETVPEEHVDAVTSTTALPPAKEITDDLSTAASMMSTEQTVIAESTFSTIHDLLQEAVAESVGETTVGTTEDGIAKCE